MMNHSAISSSRCIDGLNDYVLGVPSSLGVCIVLPIIVLGLVMNSFVLVLMLKQKQEKTNQEIFAIALAIFGWIMVGPCFGFSLYANWAKCYRAPQLVTDVRIFMSQLSAGMNIWLVFLISLDRLLMVVYRDRYVQRETRTIVLFKLVLVFTYYATVCGCVNFSAYAYDRIPFDALSPHPSYEMTFAFRAWPDRVSSTLNVVRMFTDRAIPYVLCTCTYAMVHVFRTRQKATVRPICTNPSAISRQIRAEERYKRSRRLVIGMSATLFICLGPETVFDASEYAFGHPLRVDGYKLIGVLWYVQNVTNPAVYILALPSLRLNAWKCWKRMCAAIWCCFCGCSGRSTTPEREGNDRDSIRTVVGTSVQLQRTVV